MILWRGVMGWSAADIEGVFRYDHCVCVDGRSGVDWMYKADKPEKEEYLLGRKIDKHIEEELEPPPADSGILYIICLRT